jgi:TATA-box binding protein (TBP) (component of TFIID and TFIIIB)
MTLRVRNLAFQSEKRETLARFTVVNVVATATLDQPLDLELLRERFPKNIVYDQEIYGGRVAYFKTEGIEGKVSIFWSGKLISLGTTSLEKAEQELKLTAEMLKANLKTKPKIQNIIATATLRRPIDMDRIIDKAREEKLFHVIYEPEQFPAAIIRMPINRSRATILLFGNGKIICAGLTETEQIIKAMEIITSKLEE